MEKIYFYYFNKVLNLGNLNLTRIILHKVVLGLRQTNSKSWTNIFGLIMIYPFNYPHASNLTFKLVFFLNLAFIVFKLFQFGPKPNSISFFNRICHVTPTQQTKPQTHIIQIQNPYPIQFQNPIPKPI